MPSIRRSKYDLEFKSIRPKILARDGNCCRKCKSTFMLEVHHLEGYMDNAPELLATLCHLCHAVAPMKQELFNQWLVVGENGIDVIRRKFVEAGVPKMKRGVIETIWLVFNKFEVETNGLKMRTARDEMRKRGIKCEGRVAYGKKPGEEKVLKIMKTLVSQGKKTDAIAAELNSRGIPTRMDKGPWLVPTISKILIREGIIEPRLKSAAKLKPVPKQKPAEKYALIPTDRGGVWVPIMMHGAELRRAEDIEKTS